MPGSSLWLLPPKSDPLHNIFANLITTTLPAQFPSLFSPPQNASNTTTTDRGMDSTFFPPHMTLTSGIPPTVYGDDGPQAWLDSVPFPAAPPFKIRFGSEEAREGGNVVQTQDTYFRRCFIKVRLSESVRRLAGIARGWAVNGDCDGDGRLGRETEEWLEWWRGEFGPHVSLVYGDVPIDDETLGNITAVIQGAGIDLGSSGTRDEGEDGSRNGWDGGVIWLVPTDRPVRDWKPIATREL